jgi:hypothetical protein
MSSKSNFNIARSDFAALFVVLRFEHFVQKKIFFMSKQIL